MPARALAGLLLILLATRAEGCSVPVFAYALRRWVPDVHVLASARDAAWRQALAQLADGAALNLAVEPGEGDDRLTHPARAGAWWSGTLDARLQATLAASPRRRELVRRLTAGETAVWLFIPSGDAAADAAARALLEGRLAYLARVTELPRADAEDDSASEVMDLPGPAVRLAFSVLDLPRDEAAEWVLAAQVRAMAGAAPGPWAVPVFGRARALALLAGPTFTTATIDEIVSFLTGSCSCQVKDQNPGWDLLVACDWRQELTAAAKAEGQAPPRTAAPLPETVVIAPPAAPPATAAAAAPAPAGSRLRAAILAAATVLALAALIAWWRRRR